MLQDPPFFCHDIAPTRYLLLPRPHGVEMRPRVMFFAHRLPRPTVPAALLNNSQVSLYIGRCLKASTCATYLSTCSMSCPTRCCCVFCRTSPSGTCAASRRSARGSTPSPTTLSYGKCSIRSQYVIMTHLAGICEKKYSLQYLHYLQ